MAPPPSATPEVLAIDDTTGVVVPDPLTVEGVQARRMKAGKFVYGTAAPVKTDVYKGVGGHDHKPKAKRWDGEFVVSASVRETC